MIKKKVLLYTGNHNPDGIVDYVQSLKRMLVETEFILHIKNNITHCSLHNYHSIIFIEQFFSLDKIATILKILNSFNGKKILILTEFFNLSQNTFNNFENINIKKNFLTEIFYKFLNFLTEIFYKFLNFLIFFKIFKIFFFISLTLLIFYKLLKFIFNYLFLSIIPVLLSNLNINALDRKYNILIKKFIKKIKIKLNQNLKNNLNQLNIEPNEYRDYIFMKKRYLSLMLLINRFDFIFKSHDQINFKDCKMSRFYFYLNNKNTQIKIDYKKKIMLDFSGFLTSYRFKFLKNLCKNKNKFFDYSNIELLLRTSQNKFIKSSNNSKNVCSIHLKKTKNWKYSSPSRYINSLNKNEIPLIIDNFNDKESNLLTLKDDFLKCKNNKQIKLKINQLNFGIKEYNKFIRFANKKIINFI